MGGGGGAFGILTFATEKAMTACADLGRFVLLHVVPTTSVVFPPILGVRSGGTSASFDNLQDCVVWQFTGLPYRTVLCRNLQDCVVWQFTGLPYRTVLCRNLQDCVV